MMVYANNDVSAISNVRRTNEVAGDLSSSPVTTSGIGNQTVARSNGEYPDATQPSAALSAPDTGHVLAGVFGPDESSLLNSDSVGSVAGYASELADATDPNATGLLATFTQASQGVAQPLGPQESYAPVDSNSSQPASSGGSPVLFIALAIAGGAGWYWWKHRHKGGE